MEDGFIRSRGLGSDFVGALSVALDEAGGGKAVVVGDTTHDLEMAANAKIRAIAVTTGAHTAQQLSSMPHVAMLNSLAELPDVLETI